MTIAELRQSALDLPAEERQALAVTLWQSLGNEPQWLPEWQRQLIDDRLEQSADDPGQDWNAVRAEILPQAG